MKKNNDEADIIVKTSKTAGIADKNTKHISSNNYTTLLDNRTSSNVTESEQVKMNKKDDEADTIVEISTFNISDNSSLQVKGEIVLGNLSNHNNVRKNGPWRLISDVLKNEMPNNDHVVDMIDIFPSTLTRHDGIDESFSNIFKFKNSHETGSYILSREH